MSTPPGGSPATNQAASEATPARDFLWRFGIFAVLVVLALWILAPLRNALVRLTVTSVSSTTWLLGLTAWEGDDGLLTFLAPDGALFSYRVVEECAATAVIGLFTVAVLAVPDVTRRQRGAGVLAGGLLLLTANWFRLLGLAWIGVHWPRWFEVAHVWLWQLVSVGLVVITWVAWLRWTKRMPEQPGGAGQVRWFAGSAVCMTFLLLSTGGIRWYSAAVELVIQGIQAALAALPYETLVLTAAIGEWGMGVRSTSLVLSVALAVALTGPAARSRLTWGALAVPMVFAAHVVGTVLERASDARIALAGQPFLNDARIPLLVIVQGLPALVPLVLWQLSRPRLGRLSQGQTTEKSPLLHGSGRLNSLADLGSPDRI